METKKNISYLNKDFGQFRKNLIDFTKQIAIGLNIFISCFMIFIKIK